MSDALLQPLDDVDELAWSLVAGLRIGIVVLLVAQKNCRSKALLSISLMDK